MVQELLSRLAVAGAQCGTGFSTSLQPVTGVVSSWQLSRLAPPALTW